MIAHASWREKTEAETPAMVAFYTSHGSQGITRTRIFFNVLKDCRADISSLANTFRSMPFEAGSHRSG